MSGPLTPSQTVECASYQGTNATISARLSDSKGHPLVIQWILNNEIRQTDRIPAAKPATAGQSTFTAIFPDGTTEMKVVVNDGESDPVVQSTSVTVVDTTAPVITAISASPNTFSPPNHKMVAVTISAPTKDICDPNPKAKIISVSSNEPGTGQYEITGDLTLNVLSERNGNGNGRVYTIVVQASDAAGNTSTKSVTVTVPKGNK